MMDYTNIDIESTQDKDAQKILDSIANGEEEFNEADDDVKLPSDESDNEVVNDEEDEKLYAGKYKSIDDLKKGIKNLKSTLPDYVLDGMNEVALEKHYAELNSEFSKGRKHIIKDDSSAVEPKEVKDQANDKPKEASGVPADVWNELKESVDTKGGLTEAQYEKLEKYGIPPEIVDGYLDGLVAKQMALVNEVHTMVGGTEKFNEIKAWADANLDNEYLLSIQSMTKVQMKNAVMGIKAQYELANNKPTRIVGSSTGSMSSSSYRNQDEYFKDVSDKRYTTDEVFRRKVDAKLKVSKF